jgi:uncharacterized protein (TIGR03437 family)
VSLTHCFEALAQNQGVVVLDIETERQHAYVYDGTEYARLATNTDRIAVSGAVRTFASFYNIGDIVSINGRRVKGTVVISQTALRLSPNPIAGSTIADVDRFGDVRQTWEIYQEDGTPIGSIMTSGLSFGISPPGASPITNGGNFTIVGGTGAFLGIRGQMSTAPARVAVGARNSSVSEDPANRRTYGIGTGRSIAQIIPYLRPEIVSTLSGPAVVHSSDFSAVTVTRPARTGELLTIFATGLGPTRPPVEPGQPFPTSPPAVANSPIDVLVNGTPAEVLYAGGYPGAVDGYQVNFRLPAGIATGTALLQLSAAWITGNGVRVAVQ